ncbi:imidazole glycerol phosphate synthase subunit HisH [Pararhodospirillum oryzae]|uniref:Imidazole glycerol phosphate synthase subunit HisH n=1 Tax=Pararhodospirillum oryzae TaxID=478448 RepID=A0A512H5Q5_9PROT|nr:imidazole glycerol phosphate synthase subunit HisH [Pararhodospirillum oryzae]GEO80805.1 imidazole glycerol phosphate synthase subunit HisH [Pararhodospirillum oryzae]
MLVAIIDYGSGNLRSAAKAIERAARDAGLSADVRVTPDARVAAQADRLVLPGVGAFADCRRGLEALPDMIETLGVAVHDRARPFLGICVGMQLLATRGLEHGNHPGLDWIPGEVRAIDPAAGAGEPPLRVPHMGWNALDFEAGAHPVLDGLDPGTHVYFVHSYHLVPDTPAHRLAAVSYGAPLSAVVGRDTLVGTQFHPEKSQAAGLRLLTNFLRWAP